MNVKYLQCVICEKKFPADGKVLTCTEHDQKFSSLEVVYDYQKISSFLQFNISGWDKYLPLLPINQFKIHLNELFTPANRLTNLGNYLGLENLFVKDETKNATGSFKDKESIVSINKAVEIGQKQVYAISSGNGALSASAYATKAGFRCKCFIPGKTSKSKIDMIAKFRGNIIKFPGTYEDVYERVIEIQPKGWNITSGYNPYGNEGDKITAYEIWESMGIPDYVVVPCGNGGNLYGIWKGFEDLLRLGLIKKTPIMIGVQIDRAAPLQKALESNQPYVSLKNATESLAEGIVATESYTSPKAIKALKESGGEIITVNDQEIKIALDEVEKLEVLLPEFTSASAFAALKKIKCSPKSKIITILTGSGIKYLSYYKE